MENTEPTTIDTYFSYWKEYIHPIEEEKRSAHFASLLINVGDNLYGVNFALELAFLMLKHQNPDLGVEHVTDPPLIN
ncbi:MAG: hypothetical protein KDD10_09505 [Phaeodactylibacter sp.]|nr:hypothetical protein [Phaeodactylibacter sp.]MCB9298663.1 hypothetical protein [Lewinellaceae bacterium]